MIFKTFLIVNVLTIKLKQISSVSSHSIAKKFFFVRRTVKRISQNESNVYWDSVVLPDSDQRCLVYGASV